MRKASEQLEKMGVSHGKILNRVLYFFFLIGLDLAAYTLAFIVAVKLRSFLGQHIPGLPKLSGNEMRFDDLYFMPALFVGVFFYEKLYQRRVPFIDEIRDIGKSVVMLTMFLFALVSIGKMSDIVSRLTILLMAPITLLFVSLFRYWGKIILYRIGIGKQNLLIVGMSDAGRKFRDELGREKTLGYSYRGFIPVEKPGARKQKKSQEQETLTPTGSLQNIAEIIRANRIECILIAAPELGRDKIHSLLEKMHQYVQHVLLIPEMRSGALLNSELYHLFVNQLFLLKMRNSLREISARATKMIFDYLLILLSLPFSLPVVLAIALLIKLTSKGPVLYTQKRVGQHGRTILMYKFRSMYQDAEARLKDVLGQSAAARTEWKKYHKLKNDPRVTKLGTFLRKTSLDELPQLLNVLRGNMSLVGPRPVPLDEFDARYKGKSDYYCLVRPGLTGLWQISGRSDISFPQRIDMDTWYVFNWSLYIDFVILYKTAAVVLKGRGAY